MNDRRLHFLISSAFWGLRPLGQGSQVALGGREFSDAHSGQNLPICQKKFPFLNRKNLAGEMF
jgi:hypothetical protein